MTRYYRALLATALLAGLAAPALAQTPQPPAASAPTTPAAQDTTPDAAKPAPAPGTAKPAVHAHHRTASRHKTSTKAVAATSAAQQK